MRGGFATGLFEGRLLRRIFIRYKSLLDEAHCRVLSHEHPGHELRLAAATLAVDSVMCAKDIDDDLRAALGGGRDEMIAALADVT